MNGRVLRAGAVAIALVLVSSCAVGNKQSAADQAAIRAEIEATTPTCTGESDCTAKWRAAQVWIAQNAGFKLQIVTDAVLETYSVPLGQGKGLVVRVIRTPDPSSADDRIVAEMRCASPLLFGCDPTVDEALLDFNRTVAAVGS